mmetsp:Transcript_13291/g.19867  ORF Transcript_13291/g.19867 Transcript_13291/m.19867 type:complete len:637 (-) Transcript_13291:232-2142(-)
MRSWFLVRQPGGSEDEENGRPAASDTVDSFAKACDKGPKLVSTNMEMPVMEPAGQVYLEPERLSIEEERIKYRQGTYVMILPVLFVEFLSIAFTKSLLPGRLNEFFGDRVYVVMGVAETVKGALAFGACPLFGKISDVLGRRPCLLLSVAGTTTPCFILAFTNDLWVYVIALGLSGLFAGTFTLVFAYIADVVEAKRRAPAYGLALATLGLSFTVGPPLGAFAARKVGEARVFFVSLILALFDLSFIMMALPETVHQKQDDTENKADNSPMPESVELRRRLAIIRNAFDPSDTLHLFRGDPLLSRVALVVLLYYSGVWALVTTIVIYIVRVFNSTPTQVGWFLGTYGLCTMIAEGLLVRIVVPGLGELNTMRIGLVAFAAQCALIAVATGPRLIFASISLSLLSNLVYPSVSSLVSNMVSESNIGEALGAINGVKAVTEGIGPLAFAGLMNYFEETKLPGFPYLGCALVAFFALSLTYDFPAADAYADFADRQSLLNRRRKRGDGSYGKSFSKEQPAELVGLLDDTDDEEEEPNSNQDAVFSQHSSPIVPKARWTSTDLSDDTSATVGELTTSSSTMSRVRCAVADTFVPSLSTHPATFMNYNNSTVNAPVCVVKSELASAAESSTLSPRQQRKKR